MNRITHAFLAVCLTGAVGCSKQEQAPATPQPTVTPEPTVALKMTDLDVQCAVYTYILKMGLEINAAQGLRPEQISNYNRLHTRVTSATDHFQDKVKTKYGEAATPKAFNDLIATILRENEGEPNKTSLSAITCMNWFEKREL